MRLSFLPKALAIVALLGVVITTKAASPIEEEEDVLVLTDDNLAQAVKENPLLLVEFYAPWCGHCKSLAPQYAKAAGILKKENPPIRIGKLDATTNQEAASVYQIRGFPTLKLFRNGGISDYQGGREADDIVTFMKKKAGPPALKVSTVAEAEAFLKGNDKAVIGFLTAEDDAFAQKFTKYASSEETLSYAYTTDKAVLTKYKAKANTLQIFSPNGNHELTTFEKMEDLDISQWLFGHMISPLVEFDNEKARELFNGPIQVHLLAFLDSDSKTFAAEKDAVKAAGEKDRTKILSIYMPKTEERILGVFDVKASDLPKVVIADLRKGALKKFTYTGDIKNAKSLSKFVEDFFGDNLTPTLKSEEPAPEDTASPVKVVKGKTFKSLVIDNKKDVLVEFYAPWCGHCQSLAPKYDKLGALLQENKVDSVVIAKMDATANEVDYPGVDIKGFPTLLWFSGKDKSTPAPYQGGREVADLLTFIKENASSKLPDIKYEDTEAAAEVIYEDEEEEEEEEDEGRDEL